MARQTILLFLFAVHCFLILQSPAKLAAQEQLPPAGTAVEYLDGAGRLQPAELVEKTAAGLIKVKLPSGATLSFPPNRVRVAPGAITEPGVAAPKPRMA